MSRLRQISSKYNAPLTLWTTFLLRNFCLVKDCISSHLPKKTVSWVKNWDWLGGSDKIGRGFQRSSGRAVWSGLRGQDSEVGSHGIRAGGNQRASGRGR